MALDPFARYPIGIEYNLLLRKEVSHGPYE
jgi:hypothetical protein